LIQAPDVPSLDITLTVTILPALPSQWPSGSIRGVRIRGGITANLAWSDAEPTSLAFSVNQGITNTRNVRVIYNNREIGTFVASPGLNRAFTSF
jgi:alpha-L-fucosidase 2